VSLVVFLAVLKRKKTFFLLFSDEYYKVTINCERSIHDSDNGVWKRKGEPSGKYNFGELLFSKI